MSDTKITRTNRKFGCRARNPLQLDNVFCIKRANRVEWFLLEDLKIFETPDNYIDICEEPA